MLQEPETLRDEIMGEAELFRGFTIMGLIMGLEVSTRRPLVLTMLF